MSTERKMIGKRMPYTVAPNVDAFCRAANTEVIPLFKTFGVPLVEADIKAVTACRDKFFPLAISTTLESDAYKSQPPLIREAAEELLREKIRTAINGTKRTNIATDAAFARYDAEAGEMVPDAAKIDKACEMWVEGPTLEVYNDYKAAVDALNKLFNNRVPSVDLVRIMGLEGGLKMYSPARVVMDGAPYFHEIRQIRGDYK